MSKKKEKQTGPMMVRAVTKGFYKGIRRRKGDEFLLEKGDVMGLWMQSADEPMPEEKVPDGLAGQSPLNIQKAQVAAAAGESGEIPDDGMNV